MGYKFKPNKGIAKRFQVTRTGKLKHRHEKNSHLRSGRSAKLKRRLGRPAILAEGQARRLRVFLGLSGKRPNQVRHERELASLVQAKEEQKT
ncbi:MAG: 50S ribosomal protein L35 [Phycisphaerae bacterium]|nr:50S ribosomal protein L35 [Phycisphaerae bacterium]MDW8262497.1 bL35 family ribosomal protein [Phycisphaerales bacterium]